MLLLASDADVHGEILRGLRRRRTAMNGMGAELARGTDSRLKPDVIVIMLNRTTGRYSVRAIEVQSQFDPGVTALEVRIQRGFASSNGRNQLFDLESAQVIPYGSY
jgi:hypothetical protein